MVEGVCCQQTVLVLTRERASWMQVFASEQYTISVSDNMFMAYSLTYLILLFSIFSASSFLTTWIISCNVAKYVLSSSTVNLSWDLEGHMMPGGNPGKMKGTGLRHWVWHRLIVSRLSAIGWILKAFIQMKGTNLIFVPVSRKAFFASRWWRRFCRWVEEAPLCAPTWPWVDEEAEKCRVTRSTRTKNNPE